MRGAWGQCFKARVHPCDPPCRLAFCPCVCPRCRVVEIGPLVPIRASLATTCPSSKPSRSRARCSARVAVQAERLLVKSAAAKFARPTRQRHRITEVAHRKDIAERTQTRKGHASVAQAAPQLSCRRRLTHWHAGRIESKYAQNTGSSTGKTRRRSCANQQTNAPLVQPEGCRLQCRRGKPAQWRGGGANLGAVPQMASRSPPAMRRTKVPKSTPPSPWPRSASAMAMSAVSLSIPAAATRSETSMMPLLSRSKNVNS